MLKDGVGSIKLFFCFSIFWRCDQGEGLEVGKVGETRVRRDDAGHLPWCI